MIKNYYDFQDEIEGMLKYRSKNYVNTDCDVASLVKSAYDDMSTDVALVWEVEDILLSKNVDFYTIKHLEEDTDGELIKIYEDITDAIDYQYNNCLEYVERVDSTTVRVTDSEFLEYNDGKTMQIMRKVLVDIKELQPLDYTLIKNCILDGVMFYIQDSVPSQGDGQLGNLQFQRFFNSKKRLKERAQQHARFDTRFKGSQPLKMFEGDYLKEGL